MTCKCGNSLSSDSNFCDKCGQSQLDKINAAAEGKADNINPLTKTRQINKQGAVALCILLVVLIGNFHVIMGSDIFKIVRRDSFGFSETIINTDEITGMPWLAAMSRFPIGIRVLQREGLLESDEAMQVRATRNAQKAMENALSTLNRR